MRTIIKWKGAWSEEAIHVKILRAGCCQEEPLIALNETPVIAHIKARSNVQWDLQKKKKKKTFMGMHAGQ